ncbi:DNA damage-binding protein 2-like isoform X1 [Mizuhopecten yessoensis]|uniref:DNA damage-binding protein 2-like isoform X1 n=1 Tax=Mizuhopecten yessoensis TaxID=6573 RepID=UPI000B458760|nr:DNA damage-binding protein 2-like isoform X1 [Mizuhopecten yessoensis]
MAPKRRLRSQKEKSVDGNKNIVCEPETYAKRLSKRLKKSKIDDDLKQQKNLLIETDQKENVPSSSNNKTVDCESNVVTLKSRLCEEGRDALFDFKPRQHAPQIRTFTPMASRSQNIVHCLQQYTWGNKCNPTLAQSLSQPVVSQISDMQLCRTASPFDRRVTAMEWHPTKPHVVAVGSKGGDIMLWDTKKLNNEKFVQGIGAGGIINTLKFWPYDNNKVLSAAVDARVTLHDLEGHQSKVLSDTMDAYHYWYCSLDVHAERKLVVAGDNTGNVQMLSSEGQKVFDFRLHKSKVTHIEFSPREEWLLCTSSTDQTVMFWDIRMMADRKSVLHMLKHERPVNSAHFSKTDGCRLLTTDQQNQVRVYRAPAWTLERTILHPHRFFQHITPIKATWHPLQDLAVVGRYPDPNFPGYHSGELRTIDVVDANTGNTVSSLHDPSAPGIVCVNKFNNDGTLLASGMGVNVLLWMKKAEMEKAQEGLMTSLKGLGHQRSSATRNSSSRQPRNKTDEKKLKKLQGSKTETKNAKLKLKSKEDKL